MTEWRLILAAWGAALSTFLFVRDLLRNSPQTYLQCIDKYGEPTLRLQVFNPAHYPIHVCKVRPVWPCNEPGAFQRVHVEGWDLRDVIAAEMEDRLDIYVRPQSEITIDFRRKDEQAALALRLDWYRQKPVVLPTLPRFIVRTKRQVDQLFAHPLPSEE